MINRLDRKSKKKCMINTAARVILKMALVMCLIIASQVGLHNVKAADLVLSKSTITLGKNKSTTIKVKSQPSENITWKTSNSYAVTVDATGKITAVNIGHAIIKATCGGKTVQCTVTVPDQTRAIKLNYKSATIKKGEILALTASTSPADTAIYYMSSNDAIATVDVNGNVKAIGKGKVVITAYTSMTYAECKINVSDDTVPESQKKINKQAKTIRLLSSKNKVQYCDVVRAKGVISKVALCNIPSETIKKIRWSVVDKKVVKVGKDKKSTTFEFTGLKKGKTKIQAKVTYKSGKVKTFSKKVWITEPDGQNKNLIICATSSKQTTAYAVVTGAKSNSTITWKNSDIKGNLTELSINNKICAIVGKEAGAGNVKATVDGKKIKFKYRVIKPELKSTINIVQTKSKQLSPNVPKDIRCVYTSRNLNIAKVSETGIVKAVSPGVTFVDAKIGGIVQTIKVQVTAKGISTIINTATYIVNNWTYSQGKRMLEGYYDCSSLVWKGYNAYNSYGEKLGSTSYALPAASMFDYLHGVGQIVCYGFVDESYFQPGDLIFYGDYQNAVLYSTPGRTLDIYHVAIYAGDGKVVEKGGKTLSWNGTKFIVGIGRVL